MSGKTQYEFEREMDGIFDEAHFAFVERFKKDPTAQETYIRYLKDVLFLDTDEHLALFATYNRPRSQYEGNLVEISQDTPPKPMRSKRF